LESLGLPAEIFTDLTDVGLGPEKLQHITVALRVEELPPRAVIVLSLREPVKDQARLRQKLKATVKDPTRREVWTVSLPNIPLYSFSMTAIDDTTYLLCSNIVDLELGKKPHGGIGDLNLGLKESIERLSPSSFVWVASGNEDWAKFKAVELLVNMAKRPEFTKQLGDYRAVAASVSLEPELTLNLALRTPGASQATVWIERNQPPTTETSIGLKANGAWVEATMPFEPPQKKSSELKRWLGW